MLYARFVLHLSRGKPIVDHIGNRQTQLTPAFVVYPALNGSAVPFERFRGKEIYIGTLGMAGIGQFPAEHGDRTKQPVGLIRMVTAHQHSDHRPQAQGAAS
ncbi:hypothetical protein D3C85_1662830 [compost metagenome]